MLESNNQKIYELRTTAAGPTGKLPFADEILKGASSGDLFGWTQNAGMGWDPQEMRRPNFVILSTQGGIRRPDGSPVALGYHTGHWEVGLLMEKAAEAIALRGGLPFAGFCSDPAMVGHKGHWECSTRWPIEMMRRSSFAVWYDRFRPPKESLV